MHRFFLTTNNLSCIPVYCRPGVVVHGDGVFLPRTSFVGVVWAQDIHREWFEAYTSWSYEPLEFANTAAVKGFTDVFIFFRPVSRPDPQRPRVI
ncbi:hypothetical protein MNEG_9704 [Monoraphidium neglectum]|uniref:Uncharacterized protein n=1 Tax=Monoraphidium neglectum TaxID=145388 RepID=A0A0D2MBM3_9CHLO|nr:hypothetical protein MNEG_9704 [Monoraphidium neglectum]KIY98261.1 hypothetical protein MNEG_9704 [Monoraphidium neglectum]|eukprot:XP_013897281.1 hypothetical protein MNEG_9704 [Monoraphidium neglectum]